MCSARRKRMRTDAYAKIVNGQSVGTPPLRPLRGHLTRKGGGGVRCNRRIQIAHAFAVLGRERYRLTHSKRERFVDAGIACPALGLVGDEHDRLVGAPQQRRESLVYGSYAHARVDHEHDRVRIDDGGLGLRAHARFERGVGEIFETGGVDQREIEVAQPAGGFAPIARDARRVVDDGELLAREAIEQRRFADIRPPDDRELDRHGPHIIARRRAGLRRSPNRFARWRQSAE